MTHPGVITILLVDDHPVVRAGIRGMLAGEPDLLVVGEAGSGAEALAAVRALAPHVVLMDLRMPGIDGATATSRILAAAPETRVVVLTTYDTDRDILRAVEAGATGYLLKDAPLADLLAGGARRRPRRDRARPRDRDPPGDAAAAARRPDAVAARGRGAEAGRGAACPTSRSAGTCTSPRRP